MCGSDVDEIDEVGRMGADMRVMCTFQTSRCAEKWRPWRWT